MLALFMLDEKLSQDLALTKCQFFLLPTPCTLKAGFSFNTQMPLGPLTFHQSVRTAEESSRAPTKPVLFAEDLSNLEMLRPSTCPLWRFVSTAPHSSRILAWGRRGAGAHARLVTHEFIDTIAPAIHGILMTVSSVRPGLISLYPSNLEAQNQLFFFHLEGQGVEGRKEGQKES